MSDYPENRVYSKRHVWAKPNRKNLTATVGLTDFFVEELAAIVSIDLPLVDDELEMDSFCLHLHVQNSMRHVRAPLTGRVLEVNKDVQDNPTLIHLAPHDNWLFKMEFDDEDELDMLMNGTQYTRFLDRL